MVAVQDLLKRVRKPDILLLRLTRMNLVMRGILPDNIVTRNGDTLEEDWPYFEENDPVNTYDPLFVDAVVSNPPYSQAWNTSAMTAL